VQKVFHTLATRWAYGEPTRSASSMSSLQWRRAADRQSALRVRERRRIRRAERCRRWRGSSICRRPHSSCPPRRADARVRIFTPPTKCRSRDIPPWAPRTCAGLGLGGTRCGWKCRPADPGERQRRPLDLGGTRPDLARGGVPRSDLARALHLARSDIGERPLWVKAGKEQLIVPLTRSEAVRRAVPPAMRRLSAQISAAKTASAWPTCLPSPEPAPRWRASSFRAGPGDARRSRHRIGHRQLRRLVPGDAAAAAPALEISQGEFAGPPVIAASASGRDRRIFVGGDVVEIGRRHHRPRRRVARL
jgi:trans-2,3-dihydro-3-hydroxyanthranilate isomerase